MMIERELENKIKQLSILYSVSANIGATTSADETLKIVLDEACEFLKAELGIILLFDRENRLFIKEVIGLDKKIVGGRINPDEGIISEVLKEEKPVIRLDQGETRELFSPYHPRTIVLFPVKTERGISALLCLGKLTAHPLTKEESWLLAIMTNRMGVALQTAELYAELKETKEELIKKERLAVLAQIASEVAHEIRNPLTVVVISVQLLKKSLENNKWVQGKLAQIEEAASKIEKYTDDLLNPSRTYLLELKESDINSFINDALQKFIADRFPNIEIVKKFSDIPKIKIDTERMKDVFINLIKNSIEAIGDKGRIIFTTKAAGDMIEIQVSDTGCGIEKDNIKDIFNPFFTTKKKGIGLGLPIIKRIIDAHKGGIVVESEEGKGATFIITLPINL